MHIDRNIRHLISSSCLFLVFFLSGCNDSELRTVEEKFPTENVMSKGDRIIALNDFGKLTITASEGNKRHLTVSGNGPRTINYSWLGDTVSVRLTRRKKRHSGSLGLYCKTNVKEIRQKNAGGPTRIIMEEAQLHFDTLEAAKDWLAIVKFDNGFNQHIWSNNGLYVRWGKSTPDYLFFPKRSYLHILIFQIYIGGNQLSPYQSEDALRFWYDGSASYYPELLRKLDKNKEPVKIGGHKPTNLPGSLNNNIKIEHLTDEQLRNFKKTLK